MASVLTRIERLVVKSLAKVSGVNYVSAADTAGVRRYNREIYLRSSIGNHELAKLLRTTGE